MGALGELPQCAPSEALPPRRTGQVIVRTKNNKWVIYPFVGGPYPPATRSAPVSNLSASLRNKDLGEI